MKKWYPVPPYANEGWKMYNEKGEWIATFERQEDCELAAELYNADDRIYITFNNPINVITT